MSSTTPSGTCDWTYHAEHAPAPGYWTVVDNCTIGSCVDSSTTGFTTTTTAAGKKEYRAPHPDFKKATKAKYVEIEKKRSLTSTEDAYLAKLDTPTDGDTFPMPCV
jgi:hypothetical protein